MNRRMACAVGCGMFRSVLGAAVLVLVPSILEAQVAVVGRVTDAITGAPVRGAVVRLEGAPAGVVSDSTGRYLLVGVPAGPQVLRADHLAYATTRLAITVPASGTLQQDLRMAETALRLEGIAVTADRAGRARGELGTASVVGEEAIRQRTAASLAGVLELVPGMTLQSPGLQSVSQVALRSVATSGTTALTSGTTAASLASFGTLIVVDGVPMSNNANLQALGPAAELTFATSAGGGIDLRSIPAATIERVEVIRGVPSARYGDLTQGAIIVDTRTAAIAPEVLVRYDAFGGEASTVGGWSFRDERHAAGYSLNLARTRTQPGMSDDDATRVAAQLRHRATGGADGQHTLDTRIDVFKLFDDRPENPNVRRGRESWSRDRGLRVSERAVLRLGDSDEISYSGAFTRTEQRSFTASQRLRGPQPFTDRLTEGRAEGRYVAGSYRAEVDVDGAPNLLYNRLEFLGRRGWGGFRHDLRAGGEFRREWNSGPGYQFDMEFPPQVSFTSVQGYDRPRRYDAVPPMALSALYLDDRMSRTLPGDVVLNLQLGGRVDVLHEGGWWVSGSRDAMLQPRLNVELIPVPWLRLRGGWGRTAKAPALAQLYPAPQYHDVVNVNWYANEPAERLAVLTTFIKDRTTPSLGLSRATKSEAGIELALGSTVIQLVGFSDRIDGGVGLRHSPDFVLRDRFALSDSTGGTGVPPRIIEPPTRTDTVPVLVLRPDHIITQQNRGLELTAHLPEIRPLRTRLELQGSWTRTQVRNDGLYFGRADIFADFQLRENLARLPYWHGGIEEGERGLVIYRLIHHQPSLGLVVTAVVQHNIHDERHDQTATDTLAFLGYVNRLGEMIPVPAAERTAPQYRDLRQPRGGTTERLYGAKADFLMNLQVSKTLPLDGRLTFWAFNVLDNRGRFPEIDALPRIYPAMRFGLELMFSTRAARELLP
jgi:hypothetical protein